LGNGIQVDNGTVLKAAPISTHMLIEREEIEKAHNAKLANLHEQLKQARDLEAQVADGLLGSDGRLQVCRQWKHDAQCVLADKAKPERQVIPKDPVDVDALVDFFGQSEEKILAQIADGKVHLEVARKNVLIVTGAVEQEEALWEEITRAYFQCFLDVTTAQLNRTIEKEKEKEKGIESGHREFCTGDGMK
jgi:hypothetical protein